MREPITIKKKAPFAFALEELDAMAPLIKPMFGGFVVYIGERMTLFLYDRDKLPAQFKGVSLATTPEHYRNLAQEFSSTRDAAPRKIGKHPWLHIPADAVDFEEQVLKACEMILNRDPRIGRELEEKKPKGAKKKRVGRRYDSQ
jgi:hypothetical protein